MVGLAGTKYGTALILMYPMIALNLRCDTAINPSKANGKEAKETRNYSPIALFKALVKSTWKKGRLIPSTEAIVPTPDRPRLR